MSDAARGPAAPEIVTVVIECRGPIGGECGRTLRAGVPRFDNAEWRGVHCSACGRINHAQRADVVGAGGEDS